MYNNFESDCESHLKKSGKYTMEVKRLQTLGLDITKTIQKMNPVFIEDLLHRTKWLTHRPYNMQANAPKTPKCS